MNTTVMMNTQNETKKIFPTKHPNLKIFGNFILEYSPSAGEGDTHLVLYDLETFEKLDEIFAERELEKMTRLIIVKTKIS